MEASIDSCCMVWFDESPQIVLEWYSNSMLARACKQIYSQVIYLATLCYLNFKPTLTCTNENCCIHMLFGWETHVKDENISR